MSDVREGGSESGKSFWRGQSGALIGAAGAVLAALITLMAVYFPRSDGGARLEAPQVRREGELRFEMGVAYDLDSLAADWVPTKGGWSGQDVGYTGRGAHDWIVGLNAEGDGSGDSVAALDLNVRRTFDSCVKARFGVRKSAPRDDRINPRQAFCVLTSEGRYALVEITALRKAALVTRVTVWQEQ